MIVRLAACLTLCWLAKLAIDRQRLALASALILVAFMAALSAAPMEETPR